MFSNNVQKSIFKIVTVRVWNRIKLENSMLNATSAKEVFLHGNNVISVFLTLLISPWLTCLTELIIFCSKLSLTPDFYMNAQVTIISVTHAWNFSHDLCTHLLSALFNHLLRLRYSTSTISLSHLHPPFSSY